MSTQDLQVAVSHPSSDELARFSAWFEELTADQWDRQVEADILSSRFDTVGKRVDEDFRAGRCSPL